MPVSRIRKRVRRWRSDVLDPALHNFVYIDEVGINDLLSGLGYGIPTEIERSRDSGKTRRLGVRGPHRFFRAEQTRDKRLRETTFLKATTPYRYQALMQRIVEDGISVNTHSDDLEEGDLVKLKDFAEPAGLFKLRIELQEILLRRFGTSPNNEDYPHTPEADQDELELIVSILREEISPIILRAGDRKFAVPMYPESLRSDAVRMFIEKRRYSVIGRVERRLTANERWDPFDASFLLEKTGDAEYDRIIRRIPDIANQVNVPLSSKDRQIRGPVTVVRPIAVYW